MSFFKLRKNKIQDFLALLEGEFNKVEQNKIKPKPKKKGVSNYWKDVINVYYYDQKLLFDKKRLYVLSTDLNHNPSWIEDEDLYDNDSNAGADFERILKHFNENIEEYGEYSVESESVLDNFQNNKWFFYYYDYYKDNFGIHEGIGRAILEIKNIAKKEVFLHNKIENQGHRSHTDYRGAYNIYPTNNRFLEMKLKTSSANSKDMNVLIDIGDSNKCSLALGMFHNLTDGHSIFSKTVIIEKIEQNDCSILNQFVFFEKGTEDYHKIHPSIRDFFKVKELNKLKSPNKNAIYNLQNLTDWLIKKSSFIPIKKHDITYVYLTSSILYYDYDRVKPEKAERMYTTQLSFDIKVKNEIEKLGYEVYYFGENRDQFFINHEIDGRFTNQEIKKAADNSDTIIVIYPDFSKEGRPISILFEIGYLVSKYKKIIIFYLKKQETDMPLLLRGAILLNNEVSCVEYETIDDIIKLIRLYL